MDINLEKKHVTNDVKQVLALSNASHHLVNIISSSEELVSHLKSELSAENITVKHKPDLLNLPGLFSTYRGELSSNHTVSILNVSHDLGWPCIERCEIDIEKTKQLEAKEAVFASESSVHNGTPFYDEFVL